MSFDVAITHRKDYTQVVVSGAPSIEEVLSLIHLLGVESGSWDTELALVDLRPVQTHFTEDDQFRLGREAACSLAHVRRIASLVPPDRITRISEKAARRNGIDVRVFGDEKEALRWLRQQEAEGDPVPPQDLRKSPLRRLFR